MIITQNHPNIKDNPHSYIVAAVASGGTAVTLANNSPFAQYDYVVVGVPGEERAEIAQVNASISGNTAITLTALKFDHPVNTPVTYIKYNQVKFYRSTNGGVTYTNVVTKDIAIDEEFTYYDDGASDDTYYYKNAFYNSYVSVESGFSAAVVATGYEPYSLKYMQDRVLRLFPDKRGDFITRELITEAFQDFQDELTAAISKVNRNYFTVTNSASPSSLTANTDSYNLPDGFVYMIRLDVSYDGNRYVRAFPTNPGMGNPNDIYHEDAPLYDFIGLQFRLRPTPLSSNGKYKYWAEIHPTQMANPEDVLSVFLRPFKRGFVYRALQQAKFKDQKFEEAEVYGKLADKVVVEATNLLSVRQEDRGQWVELTDQSFLYSDGQFGYPGDY